MSENLAFNQLGDQQRTVSCLMKKIEWPCLMYNVIDCNYFCLILYWKDASDEDARPLPHLAMIFVMSKAVKVAKPLSRLAS